MKLSSLLKGGVVLAALAVVVGGEAIRNMTVLDTRAIITRDYDACHFEGCREQIVAEAEERLKGPDGRPRDIEIINKRIADIDRRLKD